MAPLISTALGMNTNKASVTWSVNFGSDWISISNSVLTKASIKFRRSRPHQCLTQERLRFETFYKITQKHFNSDQFYQRIKKNEY